MEQNTSRSMQSPYMAILPISCLKLPRSAKSTLWEVCTCVMVGNPYLQYAWNDNTICWGVHDHIVQSLWTMTTSIAAAISENAKGMHGALATELIVCGATWIGSRWMYDIVAFRLHIMIHMYSRFKRILSCWFCNKYVHLHTRVYGITLMYAALRL